MSTLRLDRAANAKHPSPVMSLQPKPTVEWCIWLATVFFTVATIPAELVWVSSEFGSLSTNLYNPLLSTGPGLAGLMSTRIRYNPWSTDDIWFADSI